MIGGTVQVVRGANRSDAASAPAAFKPRAARTCRLRFYREQPQHGGWHLWRIAAVSPPRRPRTSATAGVRAFPALWAKPHDLAIRAGTFVFECE